MGCEELVSVPREAIVVDRPGDGVCPSFGESGVELSGRAMNIASTSGPVEQADLCLLGSVSAVEHPRDAEVLHVADAAGEGGAGLPGVGQLFVGHG
jgi:hypothetical protein